MPNGPINLQDGCDRPTTADSRRAGGHYGAGADHQGHLLLVGFRHTRPSAVRRAARTSPELPPCAGGQL